MSYLRNSTIFMNYHWSQLVQSNFYPTYMLLTLMSCSGCHISFPTWEIKFLSDDRAHYASLSLTCMSLHSILLLRLLLLILLLFLLLCCFCCYVDPNDSYSCYYCYCYCYYIVISGTTLLYCELQYFEMI